MDTGLTVHKKVHEIGKDTSETREDVHAMQEGLSVCTLLPPDSPSILTSI